MHGKLGFSIPSCDILLIGGDVCPDYAPGTSYGSSMQEQWLNHQWRNWADAQPVSTILATFGNHDFVYRKQAPPHFKVDELVDIDGLKVWFSPWSNTFGGWAWMKDPDKLKLEYDNIPEGTDIIVSHQPPFGYGDKVLDRYRFSTQDEINDGHVGSKELLATIDRVKPKAVICGHIHSGWGTYPYIRPDGGTTIVYNVSLVNEEYILTNPPTEIVLEGI